MQFDMFYNILKNINNASILQLEGGEPTTHPQFYLFLEYASIIENIKEIVIDTNAFNLDEHIDKIVDIATRNKKLITIKPSYNEYLKQTYNNHYIKFIDYLTNLISSCEFIQYIKFELNVRGYSNNELDNLKNDLSPKIVEISNFHLLNSYGRAKNSNLPDLQINNIFNNWKCYASDGKCFDTDLKSRAEYEFKLK